MFNSNVKTLEEAQREIQKSYKEHLKIVSCCQRLQLLEEKAHLEKRLLLINNQLKKLNKIEKPSSFEFVLNDKLDFGFKELPDYD